MMSGTINERGIGAMSGFYLSPDGNKFEVDSMATAAGATAVAISYVAASGLIATGNPYGIAAGTVILAVPDVVWFYAGYSLFD